MNVSRMSQIELNNSAKIVYYDDGISSVFSRHRINSSDAWRISCLDRTIWSETSKERWKIENNRINMTEKRKTIGNKLYAMVKRVCITAQIAVPNKSEFYLLPTPRKKKKKESDAYEEKGEMEEGKFNAR